MRGRSEQRTILAGALMGALAGAALAVLYGRWRNERQSRGAKPVTPGQVVRLGAAVVSIVRQFLDLLT
jgi:hypothetical protein